MAQFLKHVETSCEVQMVKNFFPIGGLSLRPQQICRGKGIFLGPVGPLNKTRQRIAQPSAAAFTDEDLLLLTRPGEAILPVFTLLIGHLGEQHIGNREVVACG